MDTCMYFIKVVSKLPRLRLAGMEKDSEMSNSSNSVFFKNLLFQQIKS